MSQLVNKINARLAALQLLPLNAEQIECLHDRSRLKEAADMLEDLRARCGIRLPVPVGQQLGPPFDSEEQAREQAHEHAHVFDAICIEEMASDESRSYGRNEYHVIGFNGIDAPLAAACHSCALGWWFNGEEYVDQ